MVDSRAVVLGVAAALLCAGLAVGLFACGGGGGGGQPLPPVTPNPTTDVFPLRTEAGKRYLVDASGRPFFLHGDSAWSLVSRLSREEIELYLENRRQKGFNTVLVNILDDKSVRPNHYGNAPFTGSYLGVDDYETPNEDYFAHVDFAVQTAAAKGILVLLVPSYLGYDGDSTGSQGWYHPEMETNDTAKMYQYGRFLGQRYSRFKNILWVNGGDFNPPSKALVTEIARGIRDFDSSLQTVHCWPEYSALDYWSSPVEPWLAVNNIYTYSDVHAKAIAEYQKPQAMPFFLFESRYENEPPDGHEQRIRAQAYQALLSGAMGHLFGNNPIWHFSGPGLYPVSPSDWEDWLDGRSHGGVSMVHLRELMISRHWWELNPDASNMLLTGGYSNADPFEVAVAAKASDGSYALVYMPSLRPVTINLAQLTGPRVLARWFDPASGSYSAPIGGAPYSNAGSEVFTPLGNNDSSSSTAPYSDWVLVLESTP